MINLRDDNDHPWELTFSQRNGQLNGEPRTQTVAVLKRVVDGAEYEGVSYLRPGERTNPPEARRHALTRAMRAAGLDKADRETMWTQYWEHEGVKPVPHQPTTAGLRPDVQAARDRVDGTAARRFSRMMEIQPKAWTCLFCTWHTPLSTDRALLEGLVRAHVSVDCPHHPMRELEREIEQLRGRRDKREGVSLAS